VPCSADRSKCGHPRFRPEADFKILLLQAIRTVGCGRNYLIKDRLSFMRFLGLGLADPVPDADTI
jgi:hypothetical protein